MGRAQLSGDTVPQRIPAPESDTSSGQKSRLGPEWKIGYAFTLPLIIVLVTLVAYPFFSGIILSFQNKTIGGDARWVGLDNYVELLIGEMRVVRVVGGVAGTDGVADSDQNWKPHGLNY